MPPAEPESAPSSDGRPDRSDDPRTSGIVRGARAGDASKLGELYLRVAPALSAWFSLRMPEGVRRRLDVEDLLHDCWLDALRRFETYDPAKGAFRSWMFGVAEYVLLNRLRGLARAQARVQAPADAADPFSFSQVPVEVTTVSRRLVRDEAVASFVGYVGELEEGERAVLIACGLEGKSAREASEILGASVSAVEKRWQRLRAKLRENVAWEAITA